MQVFAGANQTFILTTEDIMAFGDNSQGQLGLPKFPFGESVSQPTVVEGLSDKVVSQLRGKLPYFSRLTGFQRALSSQSPGHLTPAMSMFSETTLMDVWG